MESRTPGLDNRDNGNERFGGDFKLYFDPRYKDIGNDNIKTKDHKFW